jgi:nicotinate-nucleotide--dimethylbenzimidazole phosphoribosyltransferase
MPPRALGRLHDISERLSAILRTDKPVVDRKAVVIMAGDHGVAAEGVSAFPQEVTAEMIKTFLRGGAGINAIAGLVGAEIRVVDMGIATILDERNLNAGSRLQIRKVAAGTANIAIGAAMTRRQAETSVLNGFLAAAELFQGGIEMLGTGDMGIANTTASAAVGAALTGCPPAEMVGRGTGVDDRTLQKKMDVVKRSLAVNRPDASDGLDTLAKVGGFEIGGIAGCILAAAFYRRPVVIDGFISTAGALVAHRLCPLCSGYMFAGHRSQEPGHRHMLTHLKLEPILELGMRLGEGTGGALAMAVVAAAAKMFNEMMTFEEAGVSES